MRFSINKLNFVPERIVPGRITVLSNIRWSYSSLGHHILCEIKKGRSKISEQSNATGNYPLWDEFKFIDRDPNWYTKKVKEGIHIRLHPDDINMDSTIEIPEAWIPTIKVNKVIPKRCQCRTISSLNDKDRNPPINNSFSEEQNAPIIANHGAIYTDT